VTNGTSASSSVARGSETQLLRSSDEVAEPIGGGGVEWKKRFSVSVARKELLFADLRHPLPSGSNFSAR
jgi:hypothetical protein